MCVIFNWFRSESYELLCCLRQQQSNQPNEVDKFIGNEFEQLSAAKLPRRGEVQGRTS